jgi:ribonuclease HI
LVIGRGNVDYSWVKGHGEDPWNDLADKLAVEAAKLQRTQRGDRAFI